MSRHPGFELEADEIVDAAADIFYEDGLEAVSMRSVAGRLGVSPVPLYSRVGNKDALVDALAERLFADLAPPVEPAEVWSDYALRWSRRLRDRLGPAREGRLLRSIGRDPFVAASRPLVELMRQGGFEADAAVQACRLLMWAAVGFVAVESGTAPATRPRRARPGGDPGGIAPAEADALFDLHVRYLVEGIERDHRGGRP